MKRSTTIWKVKCHILVLSLMRLSSRVSRLICFVRLKSRMSWCRLWVRLFRWQIRGKSISFCIMWFIRRIFKRFLTKGTRTWISYLKSWDKSLHLKISWMLWSTFQSLMACWNGQDLSRLVSCFTCWTLITMDWYAYKTCFHKWGLNLIFTPNFYKISG